jgi:hypothetical protein
MLAERLLDSSTLHHQPISEIIGHGIELHSSGPATWFDQNLKTDIFDRIHVPKLTIEN